MNNYTFLIIGDNGVGKSTFINHFITDKITNDNNDEQHIKWTNNVLIHTTTNQDPSIHYDGIVLIFDIHNSNSFECLNKYLIVDKPIVLIGNKCDILYNKDSIVQEINKDIDTNKFINIENRWYVQKLREIQKLNKRIKMFEISSKFNYNLDKPFNTLIADYI